ncbi:MAG TPA: hypothetical protein VE650_15265, partial [Acetobacteraceae bacterium]|nr:hypothetical protein [Acetobacteraceae bacterium]
TDGRLEPAAVAAALRQDRLSGAAAALPPDLRRLPVVAREPYPFLGCDAASFVAAAFVVPIGYRRMAPLPTAGPEGC